MALTGAKRVRGTKMAPEAAKHSMAAPMALSSWSTGGEDALRGSTVLVFLIRGSWSAPPFSASAARRSETRNQRLLVLK